MKIPVRKEEFVEDAEKEAADVDQQYSDGLITDGEKYNKIIDIWSKATDKITKEMMDEMAVEFMPDISGKVQEIKSFNSVYIMADSGARGSKDQIRQLAGMRGLMAKPSGEIMRRPSRPISVKASAFLNILYQRTAPEKVWPTRRLKPPTRVI